ncbi:undecaprenyl-diphosphatase [Candidatus Parcubacteria bacterium]|nr:MAG: undecaprenyl-diphosphatase [Candidatus Parcubacteria bacterium]
MSIIQAIVLGVIQGVTEFLPISSSGHLVFIPKLFGWVDQGLAFDTIMHLGTLLAVVVYFRKKIWSILRAVFLYRRTEMKQDRKLGWLLILSIIPAGVVGLLFDNWIETNLRSTSVIAFGLIFWGIMLFFADRYSRKNIVERRKNLDSTDWKQTLFIGCAQAIALIPGTSRSGITMTAGLFSKFDKKSAAEFSFLMSIPVIALAGLLQVLELAQNGLGNVAMLPLIIGFISAVVSGFFAITGLMKIIQKWSFAPFVVYRVVIGVLILVYLI